MYVKLKNRGIRKKAQFGEAIAAAGIMAGVTALQTAAQTAAMAASSRQQADATTRAAQQQANAIQRQSELNNEAQERAQEFTKQQNDENRQIQKDIQMQLQMLAGQQNQTARDEASKIKVKNGGSLRNSRAKRLSDMARKRLNKSIKNYKLEDYDDVDWDLLRDLGYIDDYYEIDDRLTARNGTSLLRGNNIKELANAIRSLNQVRINNPAGIELRNENNADKRNVDLRNYNVANLLGMTLPLVGGGDILATPYIYPILGNFSATAYDAYSNSPSLKNKVMQNDGQNGTIPFKVTDGGHVEYIGSDGQGDLYRVKGATHNQYNGTGKTGVGIKFGNGEIVEAEGAGKHKKNESGGEYMYLPYQNSGIDIPALFLSKRNLPNGFNPRDAVDNGMPVMPTFATQEYIKDLYGISDDGKYNSPVKGNKKEAGGMTAIDYNNQIVPNLAINDMTPIAAGAAYAVNKGKRTLRCGGKVPRNKYGNGGIWNDGNVVGGFIGAGANLLGGVIGTIANHFAGKRLAKAYNNAANTLANAYRNLKTVDPNIVRREDYAAAHVMPALQAPISQASQPLAQVDRLTQNRLANVSRNSASSAAANTRMGDIYSQAQDYRDKIYAADREAMDKVRQANAAAITKAAMQNAELDTEANSRYANAALELMRYNNDIANQRIMGVGEALSQGILNSANARAQATTAIGQGWSNALAGAGSNIATGLSAYATNKQNMQNALLGANLDNQVIWAAQSGNDEYKQFMGDRLQTLYENADTNDAKRRIKILMDLIGFSPEQDNTQPYNYNPTNTSIYSDFLLA